MRIAAFLTVFGLFAGSLAPLRGQSLADVAKTEEERRKTQHGAKVYTNGDLRPVPASVPDSAAAPESTAAKEDAQSADKKADAKADSKADAKVDDKTPVKGEKPTAKGDVKDREYWNSRMQVLNEQLDRDRLYAEALQSRINALSAEFAGHDDPAQRVMIGQDRDKAIAELSRLRKTIEDDKDAIGTVEEEARKAGVPPGWLR